MCVLNTKEIQDKEQLLQLLWLSSDLSDEEGIVSFVFHASSSKVCYEEILMVEYRSYMIRQSFICLELITSSLLILTWLVMLLIFLLVLNQLTMRAREWGGDFCLHIVSATKFHLLFPGKFQQDVELCSVYLQAWYGSELWS